MGTGCCNHIGLNIHQCLDPRRRCIQHRSRSLQSFGSFFFCLERLIRQGENFFHKNQSVVKFIIAPADRGSCQFAGEKSACQCSQGLLHDIRCMGGNATHPDRADSRFLPEPYVLYSIQDFKPYRGPQGSGFGSTKGTNTQHQNDGFVVPESDRPYVCSISCQLCGHRHKFSYASWTLMPGIRKCGAIHESRRDGPPGQS